MTIKCEYNWDGLIVIRHQNFDQNHTYHKHGSGSLHCVGNQVLSHNSVYTMKTSRMLSNFQYIYLLSIEYEGRDISAMRY